MSKLDTSDLINENKKMKRKTIETKQQQKAKAYKACKEILNQPSSYGRMAWSTMTLEDYQALRDSAWLNYQAKCKEIDEQVDGIDAY